MRAQLASPDAFKQAGLDYGTTLLGIQFTIDKRSNGQSIIKLSSDKPINDPFVDMLLELNWPSGRLVREYTFLLDPPEVAAKAAALAAPAVARPLAETRGPSSLGDKPLAKREAAKPPAEGGDRHEVKRGDTLRKIASEVKPEGVSLDQMLVGLFRANQEAFDGGNMNRLKAGKILTVPEQSALEAVSEGEAKKIVVAQSSDWNAYRRKLAGVAAQAQAKEEAGKQESAGKITAKVEDKAAAAAEPKDQVKVSRTEAAAGKPGPATKRSEEDLIAKEKALKDANDRLASLEKNVAELQKLVELKNQNLAELQKQAAAKAAPPVEVPKPEMKKPEAEPKPQALAPAPAPVVEPAPVKPEAAPAAAPVIAEKPAEKPVEAGEAKPAEPAVAKPEEPKPMPAPDDEMPKPKPKPKPKPAVPPPPPPEEPGFIEELLSDPTMLAGGAGILALLAGYFVYKRRRQNQGERPLTTSNTLSQQSGGLTANSVFRSTGGQSVDTSHTPAQTDFSQAGPGSIDTDEVDPVAEADVYMAYGRDAQAEEILLEAKQKDSKRYAIHLKLLEIYANRKSLKQFESLATELYSETGGVGAEWEKAAAMGLKLDPQNPLYGGAGQPALQPFDADATVIVSAQSLKNTVTMPGQLAQLAVAASAAESLLPPPAELSFEPAVAPEMMETPAAAPADLASLDFDLGMGDAMEFSPAPEKKEALENTLTLPEAAVEAGVLDFDIGGSSAAEPMESMDTTVAGLDFDLPEIEAPVTAAAAPVSESEVAADHLDFDIGFDTSPAPVAAAETLAEAESSEQSDEILDIGSVDDSALEFDVKLSESTVLGQPMRESSFDMSSINLDLAGAAPAAEPSAEVFDELATQVFDTAQMSTVVNPDFSTSQSETVVNPQFGSEFEPVSELDVASSEEVATKLDLAKAYEEMGDLEGARELLQEVLKEGDATQQEKAQAILAKIGE